MSPAEITGRSRAGKTAGEDVRGNGIWPFEKQRKRKDKNTLSHAELNAIRKASKKTGDWRLEDCTMYITLEPCQMCAGAIVQARMGRVVIGAMNPKAGCAGSVLNLLEMPEFNHQVQVERGVLGEECSRMLTEFFKELRSRKAAEALPESR